jgi:hypothetical protein
MMDNECTYSAGRITLTTEKDAGWRESSSVAYGEWTLFFPMSAGRRSINVFFSLYVFYCGASEALNIAHCISGETHHAVL